MDEWKAASRFGEKVAAIYDEGLEPAEGLDAVEFLAKLAKGGRALELGIGTGRIALPLASRGLDVEGIDFSPEMVAKLRSKPGGERISVTIGDFADVPVSGTYGLIFVVFNTLFNLVTQDEQVRCLENVAAHLDADGSFVVEALVPDPKWFRDNGSVDPEHVGVDEVVFDVYQIDPVTQIMTENHVHLSEDGVRFYPIITRYIWPSELDLMARIAGLRLKERWGGWQGEPFNGSSTKHVSVYGR